MIFINNTQKTAVAVVGFGNIGQYAAEAVMQERDMELCGIVDPFAKSKPAHISAPLVADIGELPHVDVALLALPTRQVLTLGTEYLSKGIRIADIFDIHGDDLWELYQAFDKTAKAHNTASLTASGWDPGTDSLIRAVFKIMIPRGVTYTDFGPGMSMGHTVAAKSKPGVADAVSITSPKGLGIHRRLVYIKPKEGADTVEIEKAVREDPYFATDETHIYFTQNLEDMRDLGHGSHIERKGRSGVHSNQRVEFSTKLNNPAVTSQVLVAAGRAVMKQAPGAYTMTQVPLADFIDSSTEEIVKTMV